MAQAQGAPGTSLPLNLLSPQREKLPPKHPEELSLRNSGSQAVLGGSRENTNCHKSKVWESSSSLGMSLDILLCQQRCCHKVSVVKDGAHREDLWKKSPSEHKLSSSPANQGNNTMDKLGTAPHKTLFQSLIFSNIVFFARSVISTN